MTLKQTRILAVFCIFLLNFLFHFAYEIFPNTLFSIFFPVNESIFEHQKMIFSAFIFYTIIDYFVLKKSNISRHNLLLSTIASAFSTIAVFLMIWLPIYYKTGENMIVTFLVLFISIIIGEIISYFILRWKKEFNYSAYISLAIIVVTYIILAYLTYNPPKKEFFFDPMKEKYGINIYTVK